MTQDGKTTIAAAPKRRRPVHLRPSRDVETRATCTQNTHGFHTTEGGRLECPVCFPWSYAKRHARHRADGFEYSTTEARLITR